MNWRIPSRSFFCIPGSAPKVWPTSSKVRMNKGMIDRMAYSAMAAAWFVSPFVR